MKIYLGLLDEPCESWEGTGYIDRIRRLLSTSKRHEEASSPVSADCIVILESNGFKGQKDTTRFESCPFLEGWADKCYTVNYSDYPATFLPGLYTSLSSSRFLSDRYAAIPYPWPSPNPQTEKFVSQIKNPANVVSFLGAASHPVRKQVHEVMLSNQQLGPSRIIDRWFNHTHDEHLRYLEEIANSKFVLCPRGLATSTYRLYEVMKLGRVPVIISDEWVAPYGPNWARCSLRLAESRINELPQMIAFHEGDWESLATAAQESWCDHFSDDVLADFLFDALDQLRWRRGRPVSLGELKSYWRSQNFRAEHGGRWTDRARRLTTKLINKFR